MLPWLLTMVFFHKGQASMNLTQMLQMMMDSCASPEVHQLVEQTHDHF
jgi:hypothetical protein